MEQQHSPRNEHRDPSQLERELDQTRESIDSTVEELGERLAPSQLAEDAKHYVKETMMRGANTLWARMNQNAVPLALIGGGVLWMMRSTGTTRPGYAGYGYENRAAAPAHDLSNRVREAASGVGEKASELGQTARQATHDLEERARTTFESLRDEQPLLLGMASLALGALVGGLLPTTRREQELLGETRDQVVGAAAELAREKAAQAKQAIENSPQRGNGPGDDEREWQQPSGPLSPR